MMITNLVAGAPGLVEEPTVNRDPLADKLLVERVNVVNEQVGYASCDPIPGGLIVPALAAPGAGH